MDKSQRVLDEEIRAAIRSGGKLDAPGADFTAADARALQRKMARAFASPDLPKLTREDLSIAGPAGPLALRLYRPAADHPPLILFVHGGGWVGGDLETHDQMCRLLAAGSGCAVLAVTYRLAPEHRFPAAVDDCVEAARWALQSAAVLGCDPARIGIVGESAGANLAAVTTLSLGEESQPRFVFQCLIYPATDLRLLDPESDDVFDPLGLTIEEALWCRAQYIADEQDLTDWRASPILAPHLAVCPPTHVITAGIDPLRRDGEAYARALATAGVAVTWRDYPGLPHGFFSLPLTIPRVVTAYADICAVLRMGLGTGAA
ncbi:alpha/beta hydrolase [Sphingomonas sp.]|uniref:alpha/beta hydrolase n=1 Tax=Sphingomonas sp. TaxID=28214 RepID=UPI003D6CA372